MKNKELKIKSNNELSTLLSQKRKEIIELKFKKKLKTIKKPHVIKETKKDIARILTLLRQNTNKK